MCLWYVGLPGEGEDDCKLIVTRMPSRPAAGYFDGTKPTDAGRGGRGSGRCGAGCFPGDDRPPARCEISSPAGVIFDATKPMQGSDGTVWTGLGFSYGQNSGMLPFLYQVISARLSAALYLDGDMRCQGFWRDFQPSGPEVFYCEREIFVRLALPGFCRPANRQRFCKYARAFCTSSLGASDWRQS